MKKIHLITTAFLLYFTSLTMSQNINYDLFKLSIESDYFKNQFKICLDDSNTIKIFDIMALLKDNSTFSICNKNIEISHDTIYNKLTSAEYFLRFLPRSFILLNNIIYVKTKTRTVTRSI